MKMTKAILLLICIVGLFFLPMSNILLYNEPLTSPIRDMIRVTSENAEHTDYHSTDITTYTNDNFLFYIPPPVTKTLERPSRWNGYQYNRGDYVMSNLSSIQVFSYENGADVKIEWLNATLISGAAFDESANSWILDEDYQMKWLEELDERSGSEIEFELGEYSTREFQLNNWKISGDNRVLSGVVRITSDKPISVMHHKLYPTGTMDDDGNEMVNYNWDGVFSAYGKKLFTRITGDCWISALEANTKVHIWDYSDRNDDTILELDRFEGWAYCRNPIFEQNGFDDDLVLISADKPISIVSGVQSDQCFIQINGKDSKDFLFPCFGKILIHAPEGAKIDLEDTNGNQGSFKGTLKKGEIREFDFKVMYKLRRYSSFEWATLKSSDPIEVYTYSNSQWYLDEDRTNIMAGEEYITCSKKITTLYSHGRVPYPASTEYKVPLKGRAFVTVVNLDDSKNDVDVDFSELILPFNTELDPYGSITLEFSEDSYYYMDMEISDTGYTQPPEWTFRDPDNRFMLDGIPHIAVDRGQRETILLTEEDIIGGSTVKINSDNNVMVFINYDMDDQYSAQGMDLIPGLTPPVKRGMPDLIVIVVAVSGLIIALDMLVVSQGSRSIVDVFHGIIKKKKKGDG